MLIETEIDGVRSSIDDSRMKRRTIHVENFDEDGVQHDVSDAVEWWLNGRCVHRSVDLEIKRMPEGTGKLVGMMVGK